MGGLRNIVGSVAMVAIMGVGLGMWMALAPTEEKRQRIIQHLPESNPVRMEESRKRSALLMQALKDAAETDDNIARGFGGSAR
ncbi:ubiquinol-cytochrome-c reductase complex assembly factor 3 [Scomber japonicus]|uniref:ubiquinol-cytochrome-c reductase complex assembly factor 3 n=1 Tax=Scomber japonicus TaxID=13676 RepID=UPI00230604BC|nr:ubiquinol-cytochrome-c reductase complex assembly factor 3 [Scomber japonicus]XP_053181996.1 ubiquinol-cytochrome-c reductase complex assembly factor 3 [Scomber japonicus]